MEGKLSTKRRRIYSVEPSKIAQAEFARIYLSHLVPALVKLKQNQTQKKKKKITEEDDDDQKNNCENVVKHEVGMAMVWSAPPGFAWTKALKAKFQTDHTNAAIINDHHHPYFSAANSTPTVSSKSSCVHKEEEEEGFKRLRRLIPGGEEMGDDEEEMARELESYIRCLQMQVNILQCLAHTTHLD